MRLVIASLLLASTALYAADTNGYIKARGKPGNAGVFVDGKYLGPASRFTVPEKYPVEPGERTVEFRDPRYEDFSTKVTVTVGKTSKIKYSLKEVPPPTGPFGRVRFGGGEAESFISVTAGDTSPVFVNDKFWGHIDEFNNLGSGMLLPAGTYNIRCSSAIFGEINQQVTIEANKLTVIPLQKK